jgi:hypothetical protein
VQRGFRVQQRSVWYLHKRAIARPDEGAVFCTYEDSHVIADVVA